MIKRIKSISFHLSGLFLGFLLGGQFIPNTDKCNNPSIEEFSMTRMVLPMESLPLTFLERFFCVVLSPLFIAILFFMSLIVGIVALVQEKLKNAKKSS